MVPSSRTPEGSPNHCPICGTSLQLEPSQPAGDAPCPACGHLLWFLTPDLSPSELRRGGDTQALRDSLARLLLRLPPLDRQIVELRLQGRSNEQIAAELGVYDRKIRRVLERARELVAKGQARGGEAPR